MDVKLGQLITGPVGTRDAIHVAVMAVEAGVRLAPGQEVGFVKNGDTTVVGYSDDPIGNVDPFLENHVKKGQCFWMIIKPGTVTNLHHEWDHPGLPKESGALPGSNLLKAEIELEVERRVAEKLLEEYDRGVEDGKNSARNYEYDYDDGCRGC
ncbi:hypothetical protein C4565_00565 [Candidatus Parcubacteria bacterium]|nr:MAG: hypothetical protein C4565_00565 [Candidatus Parcubacteria bacterium]